MYLCVDIGGTKTLIAAFSKRGRVRRKQKFSTSQNYNVFINDLVKNLTTFTRYQIKSITVAIPGIVQKNYSVRFGNRDWKNIDILTPIKNLFNCPIWFENDASLAALYEGYRLRGKTVFLTFSTGIGGGIAEQNQITPESAAFEPGHRKYEYNGEKLEWEDIAAASAIGRAYGVERATMIRDKEALQDIAERIGLGIPDIVKEQQPKQIILGGPLGKIFRLYAKYLPKNFKKICRAPKRPTESVIYGGYLYCKQKGRQ